MLRSPLTHVSSPTWWNQHSWGSTENSLAKLSALEGAARAMLVGIVPLIALQALGSKEAGACRN